MFKLYGEEASMVMQWTVNPPPNGTTGSIPVFPTSFIGCSASGMSLGLGPRFRKFDSFTTDHNNKVNLNAITK